MAVRDILTLEKPIAPCLLRILYPLALALIALGMLVGIAQGIRVITRPPMTPPPMTQPGAQPGSAEQMRPPPGMMGPRAMARPMMERRRMMRGMRAGNPVLAGSFIILRTLVAGAIMMMMVRILAEMALAILRLSKG